MTVLLTVASTHGATQAIGDVVADVLAEMGLQVDRREPEEVHDLAGVDAVVLGSAIYAGRWVASASELVDRLADVLRERPVWVFSSGPLGDPPRPEGTGPAIEEAVARLAPRDHRVFAGALDRDDLGLGERAVVKVVKAPYGDFRDWEAVTAWATAIGGALRRPAPIPAV